MQTQSAVLLSFASNGKQLYLTQNEMKQTKEYIII